MTIEELLKPRYKVIADYPVNFYKIGQLITPDREYWKANDNIMLAPDFLDTYPHLFKKLSWWEERKEEDMPEYVKVKLNNGRVRVYNIPGKDFFNKEFMRWKFGGHSLNDFLPSTKEEFESQHTEVKK